MIYTALIGFSTMHSLSPKLFQIYASEFSMEYAHLKIDISSEGESLRNALKGLVSLNFAGSNITTPHKLSVIDLLDEVDSRAAGIGAVNTIQILDNRLIGFNTDYLGVKKSIEKALSNSISPTDNVVIFGTGGAARACAGAFLENTKNICVLHREPYSIRTKDFIKRYSNEVEVFGINSPKAKKRIAQASILCNATPVGMMPGSENCILPEGIHFDIESGFQRVFFDAVYVPLRTAFLNRALAEGFIIADGLDMMIYQGAEAFRIWTGKMVSEATIEKARLLLNS